jgi:hypothetical protein
MRASLPIKHVILDFDGTCTQIAVVFEDYLDRFLKGLVKAGFDVSPTEWYDAQALVRQHSPAAGWMLAGCLAAPVAADPYILADEAAKLIVRTRKDVRPLPNVHTVAYEASAAPWRVEALKTFTLLIERGVRIHFVSNSSSAYITKRVAQLVGTQQGLLSNISIQSDAGKFRICELSWPDQEKREEVHRSSRCDRRRPATANLFEARGLFRGDQQGSGRRSGSARKYPVLRRHLGNGFGHALCLGRSRPSARSGCAVLDISV